MAKRQPRAQHRYIPVWGDIVAGPLTGWRYALIQLVKVQQGSSARVHIDLRCTPPNWPFPLAHYVRFDMNRDSFQLQGGPRARRLDFDELSRLAMERGFARVPYEDRG